MNASSIVTIGTVVLTVLLASGCKKNQPAGPGGQTNAAPGVTDALPAVETNDAPGGTNAPVRLRGKYLGVIQLTNRCETRIQVGERKSCTIKPLLQQDAQHLQLTMTLESKMADGKTRVLKIMTVVAKSDQPFEVDFGSLVFSLTPQLAPQPAAP